MTCMREASQEVLDHIFKFLILIYIVVFLCFNIFVNWCKLLMHISLCIFCKQFCDLFLDPYVNRVSFLQNLLEPELWVWGFVCFFVLVAGGGRRGILYSDTPDGELWFKANVPLKAIQISTKSFQVKTAFSVCVSFST